MIKRLKAAYRAFKNPYIFEYLDKTEIERTASYIGAMRSGQKTIGDSLLDGVDKVYGSSNPAGYKGTKKNLYVFGEQTIQGNIKRGENENSP